MKYIKVKYTRMADGKSTWYEKPEKIGETDIEETHAAEFNAQFQASQIMYIKDGGEIPKLYSSTPVNLASQPKNEPGKIVPHQLNNEDVQDGMNREYKIGGSVNKTAIDNEDAKAVATGSDKPSEENAKKSEPAKDNDKAVEQV